MSEFKLTKGLPSCEVNKRLIQQLEEYLFEELPLTLDAPPEEIRDCYSLVIEDNFSEETLHTIDEFGPHLFPGKTKDIHLKVRYRDKDHRLFDLNIRFNKDRMFSEISISSDFNNSRDQASAIRDQIFRRIEPLQTMNWIFHPGLVPNMLLFAVVGLTIGIVPKIPDLSKNVVGTILLLTSVLTTFYLISLLMLPYTSFDSRRQQNLNHAWKWFVWSSLGFLIFTLLFPFLGEVLGFKQ